MKERPILFGGPMVRALLDGTKTQTRRVVKPQPCQEPITNGSADGMYEAWPKADACLEWADVVADPAYYAQAGYCPYGAPGDRLWVRETWHELSVADFERAFVAGTQASISADFKRAVFYAADRETGFPKRPSIFMPRWASRITLEIADVRVERVQDITTADACAEGVPGCRDHLGNVHAVEYFKALWDGINGPRGYGWASNPWVWALTLRRLT